MCSLFGFHILCFVCCLERNNGEQVMLPVVLALSLSGKLQALSTKH